MDQDTAQEETIDLQTLLSHGVQFGTKTSEWDPRMAPYIYASRANGTKEHIYIIDLDQTIQLWSKARQILKDTIQSGKDVLFVCTKRQGKEALTKYATEAGVHYVQNKWQAGTLTNFSINRQTVERMGKLEERIKSFEDKTSSTYNKKEVSGFKTELEKLNRRLGGIRRMTKLPGLIFVVDPVTEQIAVKEANKLGIPVMALCNTNTNPDVISHVIPANDYSVKTIDLFLRLAVKTVAQEMSQRPQQEEVTAIVEQEQKEEVATVAVKDNISVSSRKKTKN